MVTSQLAGFSAQSQRFQIKPLRLGDEAALKAITDDPVVIGAISFLKNPFTLAHAEGLIRSNDESSHVFLGVRRIDNEALVGVIGVHPRGDTSLEIGYWIATMCHRNGYATEAVGAVLQALRAAAPERQIFAECAVENAASLRVLAKLGFHDTGRQGHRRGRTRFELQS